MRAEKLEPTPEMQRAPLITLVSASGGVGKSTVALLLAHLAASEGLETALVEGDLQFGDMGFWLGLDTTASSLSAGMACEPLNISNRLDLFKAPVLPELAEDISEAVTRLVSRIRSDYQLVIADTGQFWSGLTGELLLSSDLVFLLADQRKSSIYGAIKALELCQRLGVPSARIIRIINRQSGSPKTELERTQALLDCNELFTLADGKAAIESTVSMGRMEELVESGVAPVQDATMLLSTLLPRVGLEFSPKPRKIRRFFG